MQRYAHIESPIYPKLFKFSFIQEVGKLLLRSEPIVFNGNTLQLSEETPTSGLSRARPAAPPSKTGGMFVPRAAKSRPRAGLGAPRKPGLGAQSTSASSSNSAPISNTSSAPQQGRGQDDFRKMLSGK